MYWDMLTAGAAAKHGHECSEPRPTSNLYESLLTRSPLSILTAVYQKPVAPTSIPTTTNAESSAQNSATLMFAEPQAPIVPCSDVSTPTSARSVASVESQPVKRTPRSRTTYNLAHPPPVTAPRRKLHLAPDTLLQLHQVIASRRPKPIYELVAPSALSHRLARKLARACPSKERHLGPNDVVLVKAGVYDPKDDEGEEDDAKWCDRAIAVICPGKKDDKGVLTKTTITMDDLSSWEASPLPNGGYELVSVDEHGLRQKCRWITRPCAPRRVSGISQISASPLAEDKKFKFSTVTAGSRRHPFIATMTRAKIDIQDFYEMPSGFAASPFQSPLVTPSNLSDDAGSFMDAMPTPRPEDFPIETTDALRKLIIASGVWVALNENWSPAYDSSKVARSPALGNSTNTDNQPSAPRRSISMPLRNSPTMDSCPSSPDQNQKSSSRIFPSRSQFFERKQTISSPDANKKGSLAGRPRRANSTGAAFNQLSKSNARKRFGLGLEDQPVPESEEEREREKSAELLRKRDEEATILAPTDSSTPATTPPTPSPGQQDARHSKTQSMYAPVQTAGLWDSGLPDESTGKRKHKSMICDRDVRGKLKEKEKKRSERFSARLRSLFRKAHSK